MLHEINSESKKYFGTHCDIYNYHYEIDSSSNFEIDDCRRTNNILFLFFVIEFVFYIISA